MQYTFSSEDRSYKLVLSKDLFERMRNISLNAHPNEVGGVLLGHYSHDLVYCFLSDITTGEGDGPNDFFLDEKVHQPQVDRLIEEYPYEIEMVGTWHTHPNNPAVMSHEDFIAMKELSSDGTKIICMILGNYFFIDQTNFYIVDGNVIIPLLLQK